ncbi:neuronal acetylcholine receptor subunit alpha-10-like [Branchiostoma lanceolatum]|uniref:neuronal acetylcholine receptor subunit alpha-10-like n=1 Tax=Branchiostoma lanceolatum TaxID=7740 RepID=UPI003455FCFA
MAPINKGGVGDSVGQNAAVSLKASLLSNYDKSLRPVKSASTAVNVDFDISVKQIIELYWDDELLTWNASEHDGVDTLIIHSSEIWRPDIFLYNNIAETYGAIPAITDVKVTSAGRVTYLQPAIFDSACPVGIERFPFDKQECELEFGSWMYARSKLNLSLVSPFADRRVFTINEEWILKGMPMEKRVTLYPCCPEPFTTAVLTVQLERRSFFYMFNMVLPCIVLMILNVIGFYIPPDSGERLGFFMTILLALVVFLQVLASSLPKTSTTVPQLGQFFAATIALVGFSCLASIVVIRLSCSSPPSRPLPRWLRLLLLRYLARLFCMNTIAEEKHVVHPVKEGVDNRVIRDHDDEQKNSTLLSLNEILRYCREFSNWANVKQEEEEDQDEWKMAALVLDRALMVVVGFSTFVVCVTLLH